MGLIPPLSYSLPLRTSRLFGCQPECSIVPHRPSTAAHGDGVPGLVGWEWMGKPADDIPGLRVVAQGKVVHQGVPGTYTATAYPGPMDNWVFNAATIWWSDGLSEPPGYLRPSAHGGAPPGPDERVRRITKNLFERFLG